MISQIEINNFRSIKEMVVTSTHLCALIGPNSTGKTNVLKAIDLVLGEGWATKAKVARELFYDPKEEIFIKIDFSSAIPWQNYDHQKNIRTVTLTMTYEPLDCKVRLWENYPDDKNGDGYYLNDDFKKSCHFVYIPSVRNLTSELRVSQWTMLGKIMRQIYDNYVSIYDGEEQRLKDEFAEQISPAKEFLEADFAEDKVTFKKFADTFQHYCKENSAGLANEFDTVLDIYNLNWFYKTLQIQVKESFPNKHFDSEEVGAGMQNLLLISIFQTYAHLMGGRVIFGIEEPEIYLYPQAQRALYRNFIELSGTTQIFYTTHNPNFVNAGRPEDIILLRKDEEQGTFPLEKNPYFNAENADRERYRIYTQFNPERNEIFFARKVLLVEGDSDKILFTTLCEERWGINVDELGISIVSCGGKGGVNYFVGVCGLIGLEDYFAIWDQDPDDESYQPKVDHLPSILEEKGLEIPDNLERFLKLPRSKDAKKVQNAHEWALDETKAIPDEFERVRMFLMSTQSQQEDRVEKSEDITVIVG